MAITDKQFLATTNAGHQFFTMPIGTTATSQTDLEVDEIVVGFNFQIVRAQVYATSVTATASVNLLIGATTALASVMTPTTGNVVAGTLTTTIANRRGNSAESLIVQYTTNGSGVIVNGKVRVWVRAFPGNGEAMPQAGL